MSRKENLAGKTVDGYLLVLMYAANAFSRSYLGESVSSTVNKQKITLREFHSVRLNAQTDREDFLREAAALQKLSHPHILPLILYGIDEDGIPYIGTEFEPHALRSLQARIQRQGAQPSPLEEALTITTQIGKALHYAHEHYMFHGDLRPQHVFFSIGSEILISNFYLTSLRRGAHPAIAASDTGYLAPEQSKGNSSRKSDQYALACIAYTLLTGQQPFASPATNADGERSLVPPRELNPALPIHVEQALLKALHSKPELRHQTILDFLAMLHTPDEATTAGEAVHATISETRPHLYVRIFQQEEAERASSAPDERQADPDLEEIRARAAMTTLPPAPISEEEWRDECAAEEMKALPQIDAQALQKDRTTVILPGMDLAFEGAQGTIASAVPALLPLLPAEPLLEPALAVNDGMAPLPDLSVAFGGTQANDAEGGEAEAVSQQGTNILSPLAMLRVPTEFRPSYAEPRTRSLQALFTRHKMPLLIALCVVIFMGSCGAALLAFPSWNAAPTTSLQAKNPLLSDANRTATATTPVPGVSVTVGTQARLSKNANAGGPQVTATTGQANVTPGTTPAATPSQLSPQPTTVPATPVLQSTPTPTSPSASQTPTPVVPTPTPTPTPVPPTPTPTPQPVTSPNIYTYSFENGSSGWSVANGQGSVESGVAQSGSHAFQVTFSTPTTASNPYAYATGQSPLYQIQAGQTISAYVYVDGSASVSADISIQSDNGGAWYDSGKVSLAAGNWQRVSFVVPASAPTISTIGVDLYCTSSSGPVTVYIDSVGWR
jgi:serine/threonine protein kinase